MKSYLKNGLIAALIALPFMSAYLLAQSVQLINPAIIGHPVAAGNFNTAPPTVGTCGTGASVTGTDFAGKITVGTSASDACTLTFGKTWTVAPVCVVQNLTTGAAANVYTVSATTIVWSSALADSTALVYMCAGLPSSN